MIINGKKVKIKRYSSGELKFIKSHLDSYIINNSVKIIYENKYSFFELLLILKYYLMKKVSIDLVLTYLPYQRMDHKNRDELDTVNYVANIFNELNLNSISICEPHCDISMFNNVKKISLIELIKEKSFKEINFNNDIDTVVLTDKGGLKRYDFLSDDSVYFSKVRDEETGLITNHKLVGTINKKGKIVIVDDIISTGDTIVNVLDELQKLNIKEIYIIAGHIENNKYNKRIFNYPNVIKVFTSNSLKKKKMKKLKLYDVKQLIEK